MNISVMGLGYIGLPLSLSFCEQGFHVYGVDTNETLVRNLMKGKTHVHEMNGAETLETVLQRHLESQTFVPSTDISSVASKVQAYVVTVGLPVKPDGTLVYDVMISAANQLGGVLKRNDLVLFRSTVVPGFLESNIIPTLEERSGLVAGEGFHFAYAAERVAEGRAMEEFRTLDIVLAGLTDKCRDRAVDVLSQLTTGKIHTTTLRIAQAVKVIENAQRDVNIAMAQQLALYAEYQGFDVNELIRMANTHPRVKLLEPGIGVGGFCIPNAYHYLAGSLKEDQSLPLFEMSRQENASVPHRIVEKLANQLKNKGKELATSTIAILGLGMKDFSNDIRLSPATALADALLERGAHVRAFDPTVSLQLPYQVDTLEECLDLADGLVVATWQVEFDDMNVHAVVESRPSIGNVIIDIKHRLQLRDVKETVNV